MSSGVEVSGSLGVAPAFNDAEGVEVVRAGASAVFAPGCVTGLPRFEVEGHAKPATDASRLFSMGETVTKGKEKTES